MNRKFNIELVNMVKDHHVLYETEFSIKPKYKADKNAAWEIISRELRKPVPFLKIRWANIRDHYVASFEKNNDYYLAPHLEFLIPHTKRYKKVENYPNDDFHEFFKAFLDKEWPKFYKLDFKDSKKVYKNCELMMQEISHNEEQKKIDDQEIHSDTDSDNIHNQ